MDRGSRVTGAVDRVRDRRRRSDRRRAPSLAAAPAVNGSAGRSGSMPTRYALLSVLALAGLLGPVTAQQTRVIRKPEITRLRGDSTRPRVLTRVSPGRTDTLRGRIDSVRLRPGQVIAVTLDTTGPTTLPFRYLSTDSAAATTLYLRPAVEIQPLAYSGTAREFRGALHVGLEDSLHPE